MRIPTAVLLCGFACGAPAATPDYEVYILVCDTATCHRAPNITLGAGSPRADYRGPGVALHVDTLALGTDVADVRLSLDIVPKLFVAGLPGATPSAAGRIRIEVEARSLRPVRYAPIATFSSGETIYQVWGRLAGPPAVAKAMDLF